MKNKLIFSLLLAGLSVGAQANNCGTTKMYERGTNNGWTNQNLMSCNFFGKWVTTVGFSATGSLKFELTGNSVWGENYGDNNLSNPQVDSGGANIPVTQTGNIGVLFDYINKTYVISKCAVAGPGPIPALDAGGFPPTPRSMGCGTDGRWTMDLFFAPSSFANADTSSPWPNGISSVQVINNQSQVVTTLIPPVSGRYRAAVNGSTFASQLIPQDCGGLGLNLTYINSTGHEQSVPMTCNAQTQTYSVNFTPASPGGSNIRFIDGTNVAYGDNQPDGILETSGNLINVTATSLITVDLHAKTYTIKPPCGTASLSLLTPNATGHEQATPMTCGADNKWHLQVNGNSSTSPTNFLIRLKDAQGTFWGDNQPDGVLDVSGNLINRQGFTLQATVDYFTKTYTIQ